MIYLTIPIFMFFILSGLAFLGFRMASNHRNEGEKLASARRGCLLTLAGLLLRPIPIVFAFYQFGFLFAVAVALIIWLVSRCIDAIKNGFTSNLQLIQIVLPVGASLTLFTGDFFYFQLIPTGWCVSHAVTQLYGLTGGNSNLFPHDNSKVVFSAEEKKLARWGILGASFLALLISEYVRQNFSLTGWLWYYSYLRVELLPIFVGAMLPAVLKRVDRSESEQNPH